MEEIWKDVIGYEGQYQVSSFGRVKSIKFNKQKILKFSIHRYGYTQVTLCSKCKTKCVKVHQLVAESFLNHKRCGYKFVVDHKDDNPSNNRVENLQLITQRENCFKTQGKYSSKYKGVHWAKSNKKWKASIKINAKRKHLGYYQTEFEAHLAYQNEIKKINIVID
jgi:hypothetical protein